MRYNPGFHVAVAEVRETVEKKNLLFIHLLIHSTNTTV